MGQYKVRRDRVEAALFDGELVGEPGDDGKVRPRTCPEWFPAVVEESSRSFTDDDPMYAILGTPHGLKIKTPTGWSIACPGAWIVREGDALSVMTPNDFHEKFETVGGG